MRSVSIKFLWIVVLSLFVLTAGHAQQRTDTTPKPDPRVGLKAGLHDAGEASFNMERLASLPKPDGFFDPKAPAGNPSPPERQPNAASAASGNAAGGGAAADAAAGAASGAASDGAPAAANSGASTDRPAFDPVAANRLSFTNSDLAFSGNRTFVGNYHGFNTYDVERPNKPRL
ncbi:MAG TPA: hypothetical protein VNZ26_19345, partial [Vicinamibacterales bacterium]|nr:hypothetical protein [Vicinamibacterales bacterium]